MQTLNGELLLFIYYLLICILKNLLFLFSILLQSQSISLGNINYKNISFFEIKFALYIQEYSHSLNFCHDLAVPRIDPQLKSQYVKRILHIAFWKRELLYIRLFTVICFRKSKNNLKSRKNLCKYKSCLHFVFQAKLIFFI